MEENEKLKRKMMAFSLFFLIFFITTSDVHAKCNIRPIALRNIRALYHALRVDLKRPRLIINHRKLKGVDETGARIYGINAPKRKYYLGAYTQKNRIIVYSKIFQKHETCDEHIRSKLRGMLAHEYTHYLDGYGKLSNLIDSENDEQTAIIGEYLFSELIWPNKKMIFTRSLTKSEKRKMDKMKNFLQEYQR